MLWCTFTLTLFLLQMFQVLINNSNKSQRCHYEKPKCMPANAAECWRSTQINIKSINCSLQLHIALWRSFCCCLFLFCSFHVLLSTRHAFEWHLIRNAQSHTRLRANGAGRTFAAYFCFNEVLKYAIAIATAIVFKHFIKKRCEEIEKECVH